MASLERERESQEEALPKIPDLTIADHLFQCEIIHTRSKGAVDSKQKKRFDESDAALLTAVKENKMAPFYEYMSEKLGRKPDQALLKKLKEENEADLAELDKALADATENAGDMEIRDARLKRAEYLCKIGDKEGALAAFDTCFDNAVAIGYHKLDVVFYKIRVGLFYTDYALVQSTIATCRELVERAGDWDRRNRLKIYEGAYALMIRDFPKAAQLLLDSLATFTSYEIMNYTGFVSYTVMAALVALPRKDLQKKILDSAEIIEVFHRIPLIERLIKTYYKCQYADFFLCLAEVEDMLKHDRLLHMHYRYYVQEMRIKAYAQMLDSYQSVTLSSMAKAFGVVESHIDKELSHFIAAGRLSCKIDKVKGVVETNRPDARNIQYQDLIKKGDILLNRVQKLSRVIDI